MIGAIMSMFGGGGGSSKEATQSSIPTKYSKLEGAIRAKDSALAAGREPLQYKGFLPQKQQPSRAEGTISNIKNYVSSKKPNAKALIKATKVGGPAVAISTDELKEDRPTQKQLAYKGSDYSTPISSDNYFNI